MSARPTDPRIRALAQEAATRIKAISEGKEAEIAAVYRDFRQKAQQIQEEGCSLTQMKTTEGQDGASADSLHDASAGSNPTTAVNESQGINQS